MNDLHECMNGFVRGWVDGWMRESGRDMYSDNHICLYLYTHI